MGYLRRLPQFEYVAPSTIDDACRLLAARGNEARVLAGGTDILLQMRRREISPPCIIGLKGVAELTGLRVQPDGTLAVGAMTPIQALLTSPIVRRKYGVLSETAALIGGPELRHVATLGGNLAGALPCADFPPPLMTLDAAVKISSQRGQRMVPIEDFYPEFGRTAAHEDELLSEIVLPAPPPATGGSYLKFHDRHSMDMTTVGIAASVTWDAGRGVFRDVRIALASSAPVTLRARNAESVLRGEPFSEECLEKAAAAACEESDPRSSWRATRDFRLKLVRTLTKRAVRRAWEKAASQQRVQA